MMFQLLWKMTINQKKHIQYHKLEKKKNEKSMSPFIDPMPADALVP